MINDMQSRKVNEKIQKVINWEPRIKEYMKDLIKGDQKNFLKKVSDFYKERTGLIKTLLNLEPDDVFFIDVSPSSNHHNMLKDMEFFLSAANKKRYSEIYSTYYHTIIKKFDFFDKNTKSSLSYFEPHPIKLFKRAIYTKDEFLYIRSIIERIYKSVLSTGKLLIYEWLFFISLSRPIVMCYYLIDLLLINMDNNGDIINKGISDPLSFLPMIINKTDGSYMENMESYAFIVDSLYFSFHDINNFFYNKTLSKGFLKNTRNKKKLIRKNMKDFNIKSYDKPITEESFAAIGIGLAIAFGVIVLSKFAIDGIRSIIYKISIIKYDLNLIKAEEIEMLNIDIAKLKEELREIDDKEEIAKITKIIEKQEKMKEKLKKELDKYNKKLNDEVKIAINEYDETSKKEENDDDFIIL